MSNWFKPIAPVAIALPIALSLAGCPSDNGAGINSDLLTLTPAKTLNVGSHPHGIVLAGGILVNANTMSGNLSLIDPSSDTVLAPLEFHGGSEQSSPNDPKASRDGKYAVVLDTKAKLLRVVKGESKSQVKEVSLGMKPGMLAWADDRTAYVTMLPASEMGTHGLMMAHAGGNVAKVSWPNGFEADAATASLTVNREGASPFSAGQIAAGAGFLAVSNSADHSVSVIDLAQPMAAMTLKDGNSPSGVAISDVGGGAMLVVANHTSHSVTLFDLKTQQKLGTIQVGSNPSDVVLRGDGKFAYVTCKGAGEVAVIDLSQKSLHSRILVGRGLSDKPSKPNHLFATGKPGSTGAHQQQIWVGGDGDDSVTVIDAESQKAIAVITVGSGMHKMAFTDAKAYVSNMLDGTVSVIDRAAMR